MLIVNEMIFLLLQYSNWITWKPVIRWYMLMARIKKLKKRRQYKRLVFFFFYLNDDMLCTKHIIVFSLGNSFPIVS